MLSNFKYVSTEQVYVNIGITEEDIGAWVDNTSINFIGKADNLLLDWSGKTMQVHLTGGRSDVEALAEKGIVEKHVSGVYDTGIFEFCSTVVRDTLAHIQKEEQNHGEKLYSYMAANNMYN